MDDVLTLLDMSMPGIAAGIFNLIIYRADKRQKKLSKSPKDLQK